MDVAALATDHFYQLKSWHLGALYNEAGNSHTLSLHDEHQRGYARENVLYTSHYLLPWAVLIFKHLLSVTATQHVPCEWIIQL